MPAVVEKLKPLVLDLPDHPNETFQGKFLRSFLRGECQGNNDYKISQTKSRVYLFPHLKEYRLLSPACEPLLPRKPGEHGAEILAYLSGCEIGTEFALFIESGCGYEEYKYMGVYREPRFSDYLSASEMDSVPPAC
jgi:hypothetical protein